MSEQLHRASRWGKVGKVSVIFVTFLVCIAGVAYSFTDIGEAAGSYEQHRRAAVNAGLPFTGDEMNRLSAVPAEQNSGQAALPALFEINKYYKRMQDDSYSSASVAPVWKTLKPSYETLEQASKAKYMVFPRDYRKWQFDNAEYSPLRYWGKMVGARTAMAIKDGDLALVRRLIMFCVRMSVLADGNLDLDPTLLRVYFAGVAERQMLSILNSRGGDLAWRELVDEALSKLDRPFDPTTMIQFYHFRALSMVNGFMGRPEGTDPSLFAHLRVLKLVPRFEQANLSRIHDYFSRCMVEYPKDPCNFVAIYKHFSVLSDKSWGDNASYTLAGFCCMQFPGFGRTMAQDVSRRNALMQASKMLVDSGHDGKLPLLGRFRMDADGLPLRVKQDRNGWAVYSIGSNRKDDGGDDRSDFVVHVP